MTRRDQGAAVWAGAALVLAGVMIGWATASHGASGSTPSSQAGLSTSGPMMTGISALLTVAAPTMTAIATATPADTPTPWVIVQAPTTTPAPKLDLAGSAGCEPGEVCVVPMVTRTPEPLPWCDAVPDDARRYGAATCRYRLPETSGQPETR